MAAGATSVAASGPAPSFAHLAPSRAAALTRAMTACHTAPASSITTSPVASGRCGQPGPCTGVSCQAAASGGPSVPSVPRTCCHSVLVAAPASVTSSAYSEPSATPNRTAATPDPGGAGASTGPGGLPFTVGAVSADDGRPSSF